MVKAKLKYLQIYKDRHGKTRINLRVPGAKSIPLRFVSVDSPGFMEAYAKALAGGQSPKSRAPDVKPPVTVQKGTFRWLVAEYVANLEGDQALAPRTKYIRRRHLEGACLTPIKVSGGERLLADFPLDKITPAHLQRMLDEKRDTPEAANDRRKVLRAMYRWAAPRGYVTSNPVTNTEAIKTHSEGHETWTAAHLAQWVQAHPPGTKAYLALALFFYTGQRLGDVVRLGRQHVQGDRFVFRQQKGEKRRKRDMDLLIQPGLRAALETVPAGQLTFLVTELGKPFAAAGFGNWFRDRRREAGIPEGYSAHGLRKAFMTFGSNLKLTSQELAALAGHRTLKEVERYTRARDTAALAHAGGARIAEALSEHDPLRGLLADENDPSTKIV